MGDQLRLLQKLPIFLLQLPVLVFNYHHMWSPKGTTEPSSPPHEPAPSGVKRGRPAQALAKAANISLAAASACGTLPPYVEPQRKKVGRPSKKSVAPAAIAASNADTVTSTGASTSTDISVGVTAAATGTDVTATTITGTTTNTASTAVATTSTSNKRGRPQKKRGFLLLLLSLLLPLLVPLRVLLVLLLLLLVLVLVINVGAHRKKRGIFLLLLR